MSKRSNGKSRHVTFDLHEGDELEDTRNPITEQRIAYPRISLRDKFDALISIESTSSGINNDRDNDEEMCTTKTLKDVPQQNRNNLAHVSKIFSLFIMIACIIRIIQSHHDGNNDSLDMMIQDTELQLIDKQIQRDTKLRLIDKRIQSSSSSSSSIKCSGNQYAEKCSDCITTTLGKEGCNRDCYFVDEQCKTKEIISKVSCDGHLVDNCHECSEEICSGVATGEIGRRVELWFA